MELEIVLLPLRGPARVPSPLWRRYFFMQKPFKTINEQVKLLQARGLVINDIEQAEKYLLSNNYYNIINGYSKYFPRTGEQYTNGTTFEEVSRLYLFDKEIKQSFFKATIAAESHLKSIFAYRFAEMYPNIPYAYLNINCYDSNKSLSVISTIAKLSKIINRYNSLKYRGSSIYHYIHKYNELPIWVLVNYLDFGELRFMLDASPTKLQNLIAKDFGEFIGQHIHSPFTFPPETLVSFLKNINEVRNVCAHNNRLLGFKCRQDLKYWSPIHSIFPTIPVSGTRSDVYSTFISIQCFLSYTEYAMLHNSILKSMNNHLKNHLTSVSPNTILHTLGFPDDWNLKIPKIVQ